MKVNVTGGTLEPGEEAAYIQRANEKYRLGEVESMDVHIDGEDVEITYHLRPQRFSRIRRITGYLVGDMTTWNNGKRAEERDRVKHLK